MKKYLYLILVSFVFAFACEKPEPTPKPVVGKVTPKTDEPIIVSDEGGSKQIAFDATLDWTATSSESWLTVQPASGKAGQDISITLTAGANQNYDPRTATVTIKSGEDSKEVQVTQKQKGALLLTDSIIPVGAEGKIVKIIAKANSNVSAAIDQAAKEWIIDISTRALIDYSFEFEVKPNAVESPRSGSIVFSNEAGSETVTIEQEGLKPANVTGRVTCAGTGVPDVLISDGVDIVKTDANGNYRLQSEKKWKYVFMTIPSGFEAPLDGILPAFWKELKADAETAEQVDFELVQATNDNYTLLVLGDMHLARRTGDLDQFKKVAGFMNETIAKTPGKVYCLTLGDMTWDMYWLSNNYGFSDYLETMNSYFTDVPFFHTMGNHDNEMEKAGDWEKAFKYTENLAPDYYSFNLGKIHYIVMDDMDFTDVEAGEENRSKYAKNFTAAQLEWLKKDLSYVDKSTPIFVTAHEPLARPSGIEWKEQLDGKDADLDTFIGIFDGYKVQFLSGHTHNLFNKNWTDTFIEHNSGAVCASWWWSGYITPGIHIAQDGAPGGFTVWTVNGTDLTHYYQAALQSPDYQFRAYDMNSVKATITEDLSSHDGYPKYYNHIQGYGDNVILVNVWDYDDDWKVEISENGTPLEVSEVGVYDPLHIYAMTIPRLNKYNTTTFSTAKWRHFFQATASAADTPVTVKVTDRYGKVFTEEMTRPKAFTVSEYKNEVVYDKPVAEFVDSSSSSLVFGWTCGGTASEDAALPYKLELFKDAACTNLAFSFEVSAENSCWSGKPLRFTFGGLEPATTYYFVVTNSQNGDKSDPVQGTTDAFTVVDPSKVSNAAAGDVILAEDFSEIGWGADMLANAAGFIPAGKPLQQLSGNYTSEDGNFHPFDNTAGRIYGEARVTSDKRLYNWGFFGNSSVYSYAGYLRVGSSSSGARTHIVSPAMSGIPAGKLATVDVTVTASAYNSGADVAVFVNDHSSLTLALAPDQKESTSPSFSGYGGKYTGASLTDGYPLEVPVKAWATKTVRIEGVTASDCLIIGSAENIDTKNRFFLSDVKVQIVSLEDKPLVSASLGLATSSSLSFTWTEGGSAADDVAKPWTISLYRDEACTDLVVSHSISADHSCWDGKKPRFVFGGLEQNTDYWFKAVDTTEGAVKQSVAVKGTTLPFTRVDASTIRNAKVGDIILGEDFSEVHYGPDEFDVAAGFMPSPHTLKPITGENPDGTFEKYSSTGTRLWGNSFEITEGTRLSHGWGFYGNSAVYSRVGYFRCATTANNARTHIVTPKLAGIPDGTVATIEVTVTDRMYETNGDVGVFVSSNLTMNSTTDRSSASFGKYTGSGALNNGHALGIKTGQWYTKSVVIEGVTNQDQLLIGSLENINVSSKSKNRHNFSDIVVKIVALEDPNRTTKVSIIGDSISTFDGWCDTTKGGAYYPKSDGDVTSVSDTWWYKLIYSKMNTGVFEKNISAGNTTVVQNTTGDSSAYWYGWDFGTRLQQLGIGNPDVVLIYGGTNDYGHTLYNSTSEELIDGVEMAAESFPESSQTRLEELYAAASAATTVSAADALDGTTFCSAYIRLIKMVLTRHPNTKIVCVIGDYLKPGQGQAISKIAGLFGDQHVRVVDILSKYGFHANGVITKYDYAHPNAAGMSKIADEVYEAVGAWIDE
ncbi:MAG: calcineurin-like phosphoesterase C-terminal domain-containing protein [Bacteroidales bacterium]|nr:calcineurin-like phosphoesterase C-terminal domain-containing protein [Bacteroidales bacterium]